MAHPKELAGVGSSLQALLQELQEARQAAAPGMIFEAREIGVPFGVPLPTVGLTPPNKNKHETVGLHSPQKKQKHLAFRVNGERSIKWGSPSICDSFFPP